MPKLQIEREMPAITPTQSLAGWRREFCVELLGDGAARVFVRLVAQSSFKAAELQHALLFHRLDPRFADLAGCVGALQPDLDRLVDTARRLQPEKNNLFTTVEFDRNAWERVTDGIDRWMRRQMREPVTSG